MFGIARETIRLGNIAITSVTQKLLGIHKLGLENCRGFKVNFYIKNMFTFNLRLNHFLNFVVVIVIL